MLRKFDSNPKPETFGFLLNLPDDLPPSTLHRSHFVQGLQASVQYYLEAELTKGHQVKSLTRLEMQFFRKVERDKFGEASFIQNEQVGGYFGYRQTPSRNEISISHSVVTPGDQVHIKILSDNSQCNHRIECFKFKLFRRVTYNLPDETQLINCDYLSYH